VIDLGDAGRGSGLQGDLRYTINTANSNADLSNHIVFQPGLTGTITLTQGKFVITKALAIDGPGADLLTVSGNHQSGVFDIEAPAGQSVILSDLTIADGTGSGNYQGFLSGGGLFNTSSNLVLDRTTFSRNTLPPEPINSGGGGAIFNFHGIVTLNAATVTDNHGSGVEGLAIDNSGFMAIHNSTVSGNTGTFLQGIIRNRISGTMTIDQSLFSGNSGPIVDDGAMTISDSILTRNTSFVGGAVVTAGRALIADTTIANNTATNSGGCIFNDVGQLTVRGSTISGNTAVYGGGIFTLRGTLTVTDSTISGNTAERQGGGILNGGVSGYDGVAEITSATITGNVTTDGSFPAWGGGGIYSTDRSVIHNTIIAGNQSAGQGPDVNGSVISFGYNLIGATDASSGWTGTDLTGSGAAPLDPQLGPLQDNGGPTLTHALLVGSPALNAGDFAEVNSTDQRGTHREYSFTHGIDIGAFQTEDAVQFRILAPLSVMASVPFEITVIALDQWGNTVSTYVGTAHFSSTDLFAQLPDDTAFSGDDAGAHTFSVTLQTPGTQVIRVVDARSAFVTGSVPVDVTDHSDAFRPMDCFGDLVYGETDAPGWHRRRV
jgi:hypothetical protein